jgi:hypothetical protein
MIAIAAWTILLLGIGHTLLGFYWFRKPLREAMAEGLIGRFTELPARRLAFWFIIFGPLLILAGHIAIHAAATADLTLLKMTGAYLFVTCVLGTIALPKSPFALVLLLSPVLVAGGYGWIG